MINYNQLITELVVSLGRTPKQRYEKLLSVLRPRNQAQAQNSQKPRGAIDPTEDYFGHCYNLND
jgi:hypothetical protein